MHYFSIFSKNINKPRVNFFAFGRKTQILWKFRENFEIFWWTSIEKLNFLFIYLFFYFFENLLLKIELSEITPFFYNNFFGFGGGDFPLPPWLRPWWQVGVWIKLIKSYLISSLIFNFLILFYHPNFQNFKYVLFCFVFLLNCAVFPDKVRV